MQPHGGPSIIRDRPILCVKRGFVVTIMLYKNNYFQLSWQATRWPRRPPPTIDVGNMDGLNKVFLLWDISPNSCKH
jgi:hypothetical protein